MYHFFEAITNTSGDSLVGYFVRLIDSTGSVASIYSDNSSTPIITVSGRANMAKTDEAGNVSLWVTPETYHVDIYATDGTTFIKRVSSVPMTSTQGIQGEKGDPGLASDSTYNRLKIATGGVFVGNVTHTTGAFKIKLPVGIDPRNVVMSIGLMDNYGELHFEICGYNNVSQWDYAHAIVAGDHTVNPAPNVRFGKDGTGYCIWIGDTTTNTWAYPQVWIKEVFFGGSTITETWMGAWAISLVTSFDTVNTGPIVPNALMGGINPTFTGTINGMQFRSPSGQLGTYLGYQAGINVSANSSYNHLFGYQAGAALTTGVNNCYFGLQTGSLATTGQGNSGFGTQVLQALTTGEFNTALGIHALLSATTAIGNVSIGGGSMEYMTAGTGNVALGMYAGRDNQGSGNVFIGDHAGMTANASNKLYIANNETEALIFGDFTARTLKVNGSLVFAAPASVPSLTVNGDMAIVATSNTNARIAYRGSDGVTRVANLTLA